MLMAADSVVLKLPRPPKSGVPAKAGTHRSTNRGVCQAECEPECAQPVAGVGPGFRRDAGVIGGSPARSYFGGLRFFHRCLTFGIVSDSTIASLPATLSTRRREMFCAMS